VPLGGLIDMSHPIGELSPKPLILGPSMEIPSVNVYGRISAKQKCITTLYSSKFASRRDTQCAIVKTKGWGHCRSQTYNSLFRRQIYAKSQSTAEITCKRCSAMHSGKDDHAFLWKHAIFRHLPSRNPSTDQYKILHD
jgi:hypothetical protein